MPTNPNMVAIQTVTVGAGGASNIEFTSIPQTYSDLIVKLTARTNEADDATWLFVDFNNSGLTKTIRTARGNGSAVSSFTQAAGALVGYVGGNSVAASIFGTWEMFIPNYANTTYNKSASIDFASEANASGYQGGFVGLVWPSTSAISSIKLTPNATTFQQYTTATLYGLTSAAAGAKATGGAIYQDSTYFYHVFGASGTFTPLQSISTDILVVAGGGGGGYYYGAGGGAGGVQWATSQSLTATNYTVTIGAGGPSMSGSAAGNGTVGVDSSFSSLVIAKGGGYGAGAISTAVAGGTGGSGGGAGGGNTAFAAGGAAVAGTGGTHYGNAGGGGSTGGAGGTGGGGGAGAVGGARVSAAAANGGVGLSGITLPALNVIGAATGVGVLSGGNYYIAGGGADSNNSASVGGLGGGGNWQTSGKANTGGGAGGDQNAGGGGSGIVIVRYAK